MPFTGSDAADLLKENSALRRDNEALKLAAVNAVAASLALQHLGDRDFAPIFARRLAVSIDDKGAVDVHVLSESGRAAKSWSDERKALVPVTFEALADELKGKWSSLPWRGKADDRQSGRKPDLPDNLTEQMRSANAEKDRLAAKPMMPAEIEGYRRENPWAKATFNLTAQMTILRRDKALATELAQAAAG